MSLFGRRTHYASAASRCWNCGGNRSVRIPIGTPKAGYCFDCPDCGVASQFGGLTCKSCGTDKKKDEASSERT